MTTAKSDSDGSDLEPPATFARFRLSEPVFTGGLTGSVVGEADHGQLMIELETEFGTLTLFADPEPASALAESIETHADRVGSQ